MQSLGIVLMCVVAAVGYGIVHDQITVRVCVEYFTIGHPPMFGTDDPTWLGLGWGIIASWWVGMLLGVPLACCARCGRRPKKNLGELLRPVAWLLAAMAVSSLLAGIVGWLLARGGVIVLVGRLARDVPVDRQVAFLTDLWAHSASYFMAFVGGIVLLVRVWRSRN